MSRQGTTSATFFPTTAAILNTTDSTFANEEKLQFLNKSSVIDFESKSFNSITFNNDQIQNETKKQRWTNSSKITKNSTLSLHITAYENSVKVESEIKLNSNKTAKQIFIGGTSAAFQNSFEFPRQKDTKNHNSNPEVMQFKTSQKLFNPNNLTKINTTAALCFASFRSKKSFLNPIKKPIASSAFGTTTAAAKICKQKLNVIAIENGYGGRHLGCEHSIKALQESKILNSENRVPLFWREIIPETITGRQHSQLDGVISNSRNLCSAIQKACKNGYGIGKAEKDLLVFGGDHSCAIGTWSGIATSIRQFGDLGLIWIDAHLDSHTPETSPSGNFHGQPVSHLLGYGNPQLKAIGDALPKLKPENLVFVGIRSYEPAETEFLQKLGVKIFYDQDITNRGISDIMSEAIDRVSHKTYGFGMSIDLDGFRIVDAPGVGTPEEGGIIASEFLEFIQSHPMKKLLVTELAEFMPQKDDENKTSEKLIANLVEHIYLPRFSRYEIEEELKQRRQQRRP